MGISIYDSIKTEYERRRKEAFDLLEKRKKEVYSKNPRIEEIDSELNLVGVKYNRMILLSKKPTDNILEALVSKIEKLKNEKMRLLADLGYPPAYLEPVYLCENCKDTGFIESSSGTEVCACYRQQEIDMIFKTSNLKLSEGENFSTFNENFYPDTVNELKYNIRQSPRKQILEIKENCLKFIHNFTSPDEKSLFFCGPTGVGKTFMANCIAVELIRRGFTVLYQTASSLFAAINEYRIKSFKGEGYDDFFYRKIMEVELLIIDDLGTEPPSAARYAELLNILNTRHLNNLSRPCKTIIATNIDLKKMYEYYDERIVSRIIGNFNIFRFAGDDIRKIKVLNSV